MAVTNPKELPLVISYLTMRRIIGGLGIFLPILLLGVGSLVGNTPVQGSISDYYSTAMRDPFEGILCAISLFLISYKGYKPIDVVAGKVTGAALIGVILFPTSRTGSGYIGVFQLNGEISKHIHYGFAAATFIMLALTSIVLFTRKDPERIPVTDGKRLRNGIYAGCGVAIIACILLIGAYDLLHWGIGLSRYNPVLILETIALGAFGASWLIKGETLFRD